MLNLEFLRVHLSSVVLDEFLCYLETRCSTPFTMPEQHWPILS